MLGAFLGVGAVEQYISVLFQPDDVCVEPGDLGKGGVAAGRDPHLDVKNKVFVRRVDVDDALLFIGGDLFHLFRRDAGQHLQLGVGIARHNARSGGGSQPPLPAGVGHDDALDVFDDVGAGVHLHILRQAAQCLAGQRGAVGHRDGLGAAHRGLQFLGQDGAVFLIDFFFIMSSSAAFQTLSMRSSPQASNWGRPADHTDAALQCRFERVGQGEQCVRRGGKQRFAAAAALGVVHALPVPGVGGGALGLGREQRLAVRHCADDEARQIAALPAELAQKFRAAGIGLQALHAPRVAVGPAGRQAGCPAPPARCRKRRPVPARRSTGIQAPAAWMPAARRRCRAARLPERCRRSRQKRCRPGWRWPSRRAPQGASAVASGGGGACGQGRGQPGGGLPGQVMVGGHGQRQPGLAGDGVQQALQGRAQGGPVPMILLGFDHW